MCFKRFDIMKFLIENNADMELPCKMEGGTLLENACIKNDLEMVRFLSLHGADLDCLLEDVGLTLPKDSALLHMLIDEGYTDSAELLIYSGADDVDIQNGEYKTPLHYAIEKENGRIIQSLVQNGADQELQDLSEDGREYCKPIEIALDAKKINSMKIFLHANY